MMKKMKVLCVLFLCISRVVIVTAPVVDIDVQNVSLIHFSN